MTVVLEAPLTRSMPWQPPGITHSALATGPRYLRTGGMGRWHRPRSGTVHQHPSPPWKTPAHTTYLLWCGQSVSADGLLTADAVPSGQPACGTCEGRAAGAGQDDWPGDTELIFSPRRLSRPGTCPGSRKLHLAQWVSERQSIMACLVCGDLVKARAGGGAYRSTYGPESHQPGPGLIQGCPFHAWAYLTAVADRAVCQCQAGEHS